MVSQTNDQTLEAAIEKALTDTCLEMLKNQVSEAAPDLGKNQLTLCSSMILLG